MLITKVPLKVITLHNVSIFDQLKMEEYLLRDTTDNYCIINQGSPPSIVMGISGVIGDLVYEEKLEEAKIPLIKRFSGGGTVVIDENTLFITFICNSKETQVPCFPEPIFKFSEGIYKKVFCDLPFQLKQNDYIFNDKKFGGNAQYIKKDRWLHHTSFLWDYVPHLMNLLKHPSKTPEYREGRSHTDFICTLKPYFSSKEAFLNHFVSMLDSFFLLEQLEEAPQGFEPSRSSTHYIDLNLH